MPPRVKSYVKNKGDDVKRVDISVRGKLSPIAADLWEQYDNKSKLVHDALEQYATFGKQVTDDLTEIKQILRRWESDKKSRQP